MKIKFSAILNSHDALAAVQRNGYALRYVKDQTEAVALAAVQRNGDALQYVKDQTEAVALAAVQHNGYALRYVLDFDLFKSIALKLSIDIEI
jgi:hypothetical protein